MPDGKPRHGLQRALTTGLLAYLVLLGAAVVTQGWLVNERAEGLVWEALLSTEMDYFLDHADKPGWKLRETAAMEVFVEGVGPPPPAALADLEPGLHDELAVDGGVVVAMVRLVDGRRVWLALDITEFEQTEREQLLVLLLSSFVVVVLLGLAGAWGVSQMMAPLRDLAQRISLLRPDVSGQSVAMTDRYSAELAVIANALNLYLNRQDRFVERERAFIHSASHELRTPMAIIAGASELALEADMSPPARAQVQRIQRTAQNIEELISTLLVLAKDPENLGRISDLFAVDELLPEIVDAHRHLCDGKALVMTMDLQSECNVIAPIAIVQVAVGNLLRNAIENSDSGTITLELRPGATVVIEDPGHGMPPEQVAAAFGRGVRTSGRSGSGIGLDLVARICDHLGWKLEIGPRPLGRGTRATLDLGASTSSRP